MNTTLSIGDTFSLRVVNITPATYTVKFAALDSSVTIANTALTIQPGANYDLTIQVTSFGPSYTANVM